MLLDKVRKTVLLNSLLENGDNVICAVSGGADSICLLHVMQRLKKEFNINVFAANVNHMIRGVEGDRDSEFVKGVCKASDTPLYYKSFNVPEISSERKIGTEECGRILRYEFFNEIAEKLGGAKIATGHNLNDNAETVLFRLIRGSAAEGIRGISPKRDNIIRPLIDISREEIVNYLKSNSIRWVEDSTNSETLYSRNKIRLGVMPAFMEINPLAPEKIVNTAALITEDDNYLSECADVLLEKCFSRNAVEINILRNAPIPVKRRAAKKILTEWKVKEITSKKIDSFLDFLSKESGRAFDIDKNNHARICYGYIIKEKKNDEAEIYFEIKKNESIDYGFWKIKIYESDIPVKRRSNNIAVFDGDKLTGSFVVRSRKEGDKMNPLGMNGRKKLSDIFSDAKILPERRSRIPIVEHEGNIIYIGGLRQSELYKADEFTNNFLIIEYIAKE